MAKKPVMPGELKSLLSGFNTSFEAQKNHYTTEKTKKNNVHRLVNGEYDGEVKQKMHKPLTEKADENRPLSTISGASNNDERCENKDTETDQYNNQYLQKEGREAVKNDQNSPLNTSQSTKKNATDCVESMQHEPEISNKNIEDKFKNARNKQKMIDTGYISTIEREQEITDKNDTNNIAVGIPSRREDNKTNIEDLEYKPTQNVFPAILNYAQNYKERNMDMTSVVLTNDIKILLDKLKLSLPVKTPTKYLLSAVLKMFFEEHKDEIKKLFQDF